MNLLILNNDNPCIIITFQKYICQLRFTLYLRKGFQMEILYIINDIIYIYCVKTLE